MQEEVKQEKFAATRPESNGLRNNIKLYLLLGWVHFGIT